MQIILSLFHYEYFMDRSNEFSVTGYLVQLNKPYRLWYNYVFIVEWNIVSHTVEITGAQSFLELGFIFHLFVSQTIHLNIPMDGLLEHQLW